MIGSFTLRADTINYFTGDTVSVLKVWGLIIISTTRECEWNLLDSFKKNPKDILTMSDFFRQIFTPVSKFWIIPNPSWLSHYPTRCSVLSRRVSVDRGIAEFEETNFKQVFVTFYSELVLVRGNYEKKIGVYQIHTSRSKGRFLPFFWLFLVSDGGNTEQWPD